MNGSKHFFFFFHYFQVYCPNNMLQPRAQMRQMHLGQEPRDPSQGYNGGTQDFSFMDRAGRVEHTSGHARELGEGWPGSGKTTAFKAQPLPL